MDVLTKEQRHKAMSHIRFKDTSIEVKLRKALWHKGYRYRKNYGKLPGKPDIALTKYKIAVFVIASFSTEKTGILSFAQESEEEKIRSFGKRRSFAIWNVMMRITRNFCSLAGL